MYIVTHTSLITNTSGKVNFNTLEEAQNYVDTHISENNFGKPERWLPEYLEGAQTREITDMEETITEYLHPAEYTYSIVEDFSQEIAALKPIMDQAIYLEAYNVFGTTDVQSMNAFSQSWALKRDNPDYYVADGLIATKAYPGFPLGTPLNTSEKIRAYFTARCLDLIAFDRFRDQKIQEYLVAKAELESR